MELLSGHTLFKDPLFPLAVVSFDQGDRRLHRHDFLELVLIRSGAGLHLYEGKAYPGRAGDLLVIPEGRVHGYANPSGLNLVNICFKETSLLAAFPGLLDSSLYAAVFRLSPFFRSEYSDSGRLSPDPVSFGRISRAAEELESELRGESPECRWIAAGLLARIVALVCRAGVESASSSGTDHRGTVAFRLGSLVAALRARPERVLSVPEMAGYARISESSLLRCFKNAFGTTPLRYRDALRMERAAELLAATDRPVSEIALELGFTDGNYFSRRFRALVGESPGAYRKNRKNRKS
jgi:AraC-like DNA-binding protein